MTDAPVAQLVERQLPKLPDTHATNIKQNTCGGRQADVSSSDSNGADAASCDTVRAIAQLAEISAVWFSLDAKQRDAIHREAIRAAT